MQYLISIVLLILIGGNVVQHSTTNSFCVEESDVDVIINDHEGANDEPIKKLPFVLWYATSPVVIPVDGFINLFTFCILIYALFVCLKKWLLHCTFII